MKIWTKGKRLAAALLAVALLLSILPSGVLPAHSEESEMPAVDYGQFIGYFAEVHLQDFQELTVSADPSGTISDQLQEEDLQASIVLQIVDYYVDGSALWYKVAAAPGYTLPQKLAANPWIFQNNIGASESKNALTLKKPAFSNAAASVVSANGVMVSSDAVEFTGMSAVSMGVSLEESYIDSAVLYDIDLQTASGSYFGYATVTIPIPAGWDTGKIFGFVQDGKSVTMIPGTVNDDGTFSVTVAQCAYVGMAQITDVTALESMIIAFERVQEENAVTLPGVIGTAGRYTSEDGAVEYVISHEAVTGNNGTVTYTTRITFQSLCATDGAHIEIGNCTYTVKVNSGSAKVEKLLTAGGTASTTLNPLYDLGITGPYTAEYQITDGACVELDDKEGTIRIASGFTGMTPVKATVVATVRHKTTGKPIATVTYTVTVSGVDVDDVKTLYIPQGSTVTITKFKGELITEGFLNAEIATVESATDTENGNKILITGKKENSETYFVVNTGSQKILFAVCVGSANSQKSYSHYVWLGIESNPNCTIYYAIDGGRLHRVEASATGQVVLIGLDSDPAQQFPEIMVFSAPNAGYATSKMYIAGPTDAYDCLSDVEINDLYARALALGCDGVTSITSTDYNANPVLNASFVAEKLPELKKTIVKVFRDEKIIHDENNPYDAAVHFLKIGDIITYKFEVEIESQYLTYDFTITDPYITENISALSIDDLTIGGTAATVSTGEIDENAAASTVVSHSETGISIEFVNVSQTVSFTVDYKLNATDIKAYAEGKFETVATLDCTYASDTAVGGATVQTDAIAVCKIENLLTWKDSFGHIIAVCEASSNATVSHPTELLNYAPYYAFEGWYIGSEPLTGNTYTTGGTGRSVTIVAKYAPAQYSITYDLGDGVILPGGATVSYAFGDAVNIPVPVKAGYDFIGWEVKVTDGTAENWPDTISCDGEYVITEVYGNVTLIPKWSRTTLKIQVAGWDEIDEGQTFLFTITDENGLSLDVVVAGNGYVIIEGLDSDTQYTITQKTEWSWRYGLKSISCEDDMHMTISGSSVTVTLVYNEENTVTFTQERVKDQWLDGNGDNFSSQN